MFYVASRAFTQESFLTYKDETTTLIIELFLWFPVKGPPDMGTKEEVKPNFRTPPR
jgi:hypothetical protein